ncbi:MAG: ABC transporter ATP-binding protein, partial [Calditrichaeota bacterium]|nr:ABC transporter ATP-binding protein [Calditrichota bacterium]
MISLKNISKTFDSFPAVDHLTLEVNKEFFVFLGPNGAGKTSTIKMMTGLITPTSGEISINGINLLQNPIEAKKQFGLVPDQPALYEKLTAREFVQFVGTVYKVPDTKVEERMNRLFDIFELADRLDDLIEDFSHGMKQKVALVAALIHEPAVLF